MNERNNLECIQRPCTSRIFSKSDPGMALREAKMLPQIQQIMDKYRTNKGIMDKYSSIKE